LKLYRNIMNKKYTTLGRLVMAGFFTVSMAFFSSCGTDAEKTVTDGAEAATEAATEMVDDSTDAMNEMAEDVVDAAGDMKEDMEGMDSQDADLDLVEGDAEVATADSSKTMMESK
jgi:hypothetical protein